MQLYKDGDMVVPIKNSRPDEHKIMIWRNWEHNNCRYNREKWFKAHGEDDLREKGSEIPIRALKMYKGGLGVDINQYFVTKAKLSRYRAEYKSVSGKYDAQEAAYALKSKAYKDKLVIQKAAHEKRESEYKADIRKVRERSEVFRIGMYKEHKMWKDKYAALKEEHQKDIKFFTQKDDCSQEKIKILQGKLIDEAKNRVRDNRIDYYELYNCLLTQLNELFECPIMFEKLALPHILLSGKTIGKPAFDGLIGSNDPFDRTKQVSTPIQNFLVKNIIEAVELTEDLKEQKLKMSVFEISTQTTGDTFEDLYSRISTLSNNLMVKTNQYRGLKATYQDLITKNIETEGELEATKVINHELSSKLVDTFALSKRIWQAKIGIDEKHKILVRKWDQKVIESTFEFLDFMYRDSNGLTTALLCLEVARGVVEKVVGKVGRAKMWEVGVNTVVDRWDVGVGVSPKISNFSHQAQFQPPNLF